ncbi:MAG: hypothetical protein AUH28_19150 [Acidobacteria bacterium 13_1_40CM_56_16]|nr:MAG: hypothetical protein AUH28_19150 [Acidobacteria bacterium 13_1_40CM_56_16]
MAAPLIRTAGEPSDPDIGAGFTIRRVDVEQVYIRKGRQSAAKCLRAVLGAEPPAGSGGDALGVVERRNIRAREPQPSGARGADFAGAAGFFQPLRNDGRNFRAQTGGIKFPPVRLREFRGNIRGRARLPGAAET